MKKTIFIILLFIFSCDNGEGDNDKAPYVLVEIADITVNEGTGNDREINLANVFSDDDNETSKMTFKVFENTNPNLVLAEIDSINKMLYLIFSESVIGTATIKIEATSNGKTVIDAFLVTVNKNETFESVETAENAYNSGSFSDAEAAFQVAITKGDPRYVELAYVGLGFSQLAQGQAKHSAALTSLYEGLNLDASAYQNDFRAGIALLEYAYMKNNENAITYANQLLSANSSWQMEFDSNINHSDVRLTLAMAYYDSQEFALALAQVKILDNAFELMEGDDNFLTLLANKLRALSDQLD